jgi:hypothetical protein
MSSRHAFIAGSLAAVASVRSRAQAPTFLVRLFRADDQPAPLPAG